MLKKNTLVVGPMFGGVQHVAALVGRIHGAVPTPIRKPQLTEGASGGARREPGLFYGVLKSNFAEFTSDYDVILVRREPRDLLISMAEGLVRSKTQTLDAVAQALKPMATEQRLLAVLAGVDTRFKAFERHLDGWYEWLLEGATPVAYEGLFEKEGRAEVARMLRVSPAQVERAAAEILPDIERDWWNVPGAWKDKFTLNVSAAYDSMAFKAEGQISVIPPVRLHKGKMQMVRAY